MLKTAVTDFSFKRRAKMLIKISRIRKDQAKNFKALLPKFRQPLITPPTSKGFANQTFFEIFSAVCVFGLQEKMEINSAHVL